MSEQTLVSRREVTHNWISVGGHPSLTASPTDLTGTVGYLDFSKYLNHVAQESEYKLRTQGSSYRRGFLLHNQATLCSLPGAGSIAWSSIFSWFPMLHYKVSWLCLKPTGISKSPLQKRFNHMMYHIGLKIK